jgi:peptide/nickel transport system substrate-binding protein
VDFADTITSQNVPTVQKNKKLHLVEKPGFGFAGFWINVKSPGLTNKLVRQAISLLIDRTAYVKAIANKTAKPANSPFGPGSLAHGPWDKAPKRNVAKAKQLLAKAKASDLSFTFSTTTDPVASQAAQIIQQFLAAGGISMKIQTTDFPTLLTNTTKHNFEVAAIGWSGRPDPDQNAYNWFITDGPFNDGQYSSKVVDTNLKKGRSSSNARARKAAYAKVAKQLATDVPYVFLDHPNNSFGMSAKLKGFQVVPDGIIRAVSMTK